MEKKVVQIILVDDHRKIHQAISTAIELEDDIEIIGHASNGREAVTLCEELHPDLVIMDVVMPGMDGIEATQIIHTRFPDIKILALTSFTDLETIHDILKAGAVGYILKDSPADDLAKVIRAASTGHAVFSFEVFTSLSKGEQPQPSKDYGLTNAELEVLKLLINGYSNQQIAVHLSVTLSTAKYHVSNILTKLNVQSRTEAVSLALKEHLTGSSH